MRKPKDKKNNKGKKKNVYVHVKKEIYTYAHTCTLGV